MTVGDLRYWLAWLVGVVACAAAVWLLKWSFFGDKEARTRRCPKCWHNLAGTPGMTCGECGYTATVEDDLHRVRRRWRLGVFTVTFVVVGASYVYLKFTERGVIAVLPTKAIILLLPVLDTTPGGAHTELLARMRSDELSLLEWNMFVDRAISGDREAPPASGAWQNKYGIVFDTWPSGHWQALDLEAKVLRLTPHVEAKTRTVWPEDVPICVEIQLREWWPDATRGRLSITPKSPAGDPVVVQRVPDVPWLHGFPIVVPAPGRGPSDIVLEIAVERLHPRLDAEWVSVTTQTVRVPVHVHAFEDASATELITPIRSDLMDRLVDQMFSIPLRRHESGDLPVVIPFDPGPAYHPAFNEVAMGLVIEVLHHGVPVRTSRGWWMGNDYNVQPTIELPRFHYAALDSIESGHPDWSLRIRGDREVALRVEGASKYWAGEVVKPLVIADAPGTGLNQRWIVEEERTIPAAPQ